MRRQGGVWSAGEDASGSDPYCRKGVHPARVSYLPVCLRPPHLPCSFTPQSTPTRSFPPLTVAEGVDVARLVLAAQALLVAQAVLRDVLGVALGQALDGGEDGLHAARLAHRLGRVVGVPSGAVPVALDGLGVERADNVKVLSQPAEEGGGEGGGWDEGSGLEVWNVQTMSPLSCSCIPVTNPCSS